VSERLISSRIPGTPGPGQSLPVRSMPRNGRTEIASER